MRRLVCGFDCFEGGAGAGDDDLLPGGGAPAPAPAGGARRAVDDGPREVKCGFCSSRNTLRGEVIKLSAEAHEMRDHETTIRELKRELKTANDTIADLRAKLTPAQPAGRSSMIDESLI